MHKPGDRIEVRIQGEFDLGFMVETAAGAVGQLRYPEMSMDMAQLNREAPQQAIGIKLDVFVMVFEPNHSFRVSQLTPTELQSRQQEPSARRHAVSGSRHRPTVWARFDHCLICRDPLLGDIWTPIEGSEVANKVLAANWIALSKQQWSEAKVGDRLDLILVKDAEGRLTFAVDRRPSDQST